MEISITHAVSFVSSLTLSPFNPGYIILILESSLFSVFHLRTRELVSASPQSVRIFQTLNAKRRKKLLWVFAKSTINKWFVGSKSRQSKTRSGLAIDHPVVPRSCVVLSVWLHHVDGMSCKLVNVRFVGRPENDYFSSTDDKWLVPSSPLSLTTLPLCCVVTIDAQSTKTNKRAIFTRTETFSCFLSSNTSLLCPIQVYEDPNSIWLSLHTSHDAVSFSGCLLSLRVASHTEKPLLLSAKPRL